MLKHLFAVLLSLVVAAPAFAQLPTGLGSLSAAQQTSFSDTNNIPLCQLPDACVLNTDAVVNATMGQIATYLAQRTTTVTNWTINCTNNTCTNLPSAALTGNVAAAQMEANFAAALYAEFTPTNNGCLFGNGSTATFTATCALIGVQNTFVPQREDLCTLSGTSPTPTAAGCSGWSETLTGNTTVGCVTGLPSTAGLMEHHLFRFQQPASGGPFGVRFATTGCYSTAALGEQPVLSTTASVADYVEGMAIGGGALELIGNGMGLNGVAETSNIVARTNAPTPCVGSTGTTVSCTIDGSTAGDLRVVGLSFCPVSNSCPVTTGGTAPTSVTDGTNGCTQVSNTFNNGSFNGVGLSWWFCRKIQSGNWTVTATWGSTVYFPTMFIAEFSSPLWLQQADAGLGNTGGSSSSSPTSTAATNGSTTLNGELVVGLFNSTGAPTPTNGVLIKEDGGGNNMAAYLLPFTVGSQQINASQATNPWVSSTAVIE